MRKFERGWRDGRKGFFLKRGINSDKMCMSGISVYYMSLFRIPSSVCKGTEKYMRDFLGRGLMKVMGPIC